MLHGPLHLSCVELNNVGEMKTRSVAALIAVLLRHFDFLFCGSCSVMSCSFVVNVLL
jgi:hypothetical protein